MPAPKKYPDMLRERAVRMVFEIREQTGQRKAGCSPGRRAAVIIPEALRNWMNQAEVGAGQRPGTSTDARQRIAELEREVREMRRANEVLKSASAFLPAELDRPFRR